MPPARLTGHERLAIAIEIRRRQRGEEPLDYPDESLKELKAMLRDKDRKPQPMAPGYNRADPRR